MSTLSKNERMRFKAICFSLVNESIPINQLQLEVTQLKSLLLSVSILNNRPNTGIAESETSTANGLAISPSHAALCLDDYIRTITFIQGMYHAINDLFKPQKHPIEVLYVGCGPFAALVLPLLEVMADQPVHFTLIDIHQESVTAVKNTLDSLQLNHKVRDVLCQDVMKYKPAEGYHADLILTEVMQAALRKEPQVAVSCYMKQLFPKAKLIPEVIHVNLKWIDPAYEFNPDCLDKSTHTKDSDRLFTLDESKLYHWPLECTSLSSDQSLPANCVEIPKNLNHNAHPMFFTHIGVYKHHQIKPHQSGLTSPISAVITGQIKAGQQIQFQYHLGSNPGLIGAVIK